MSNYCIINTGPTQVVNNTPTYNLTPVNYPAQPVFTTQNYNNQPAIQIYGIPIVYNTSANQPAIPITPAYIQPQNSPILINYQNNIAYQNPQNEVKYVLTLSTNPQYALNNYYVGYIPQQGNCITNNNNLYLGKPDIESDRKKISEDNSKYNKRYSSCDSKPSHSLSSSSSIMINSGEEIISNSNFKSSKYIKKTDSNDKYNLNTRELFDKNSNNDYNSNDNDKIIESNNNNRKYYLSREKEKKKKIKDILKDLKGQIDDLKNIIIKDNYLKETRSSLKAISSDYKKSKNSLHSSNRKNSDESNTYDISISSIKYTDSENKNRSDRKIEQRLLHYLNNGNYSRKTCNTENKMSQFLRESKSKFNRFKKLNENKGKNPIILKEIESFEISDE